MTHFFPREISELLRSIPQAQLWRAYSCARKCADRLKLSPPPSTSNADQGQHKLRACRHAASGQFDQLISEIRVSRCQCIICPHRFREVLLPLAILLEDLLPGRSHQHTIVITKKLHGFLNMPWNGKLHQTQIPGNIRHAAIKENPTCRSFRDAVRPHLPGEHVLCEQRRIDPRQRPPADRDLLLNDAAPGLDCSVEAYP